jgi:S1-C subfamily serine protease
VAERSGLRPGDTILEVNGTPFTSINHEEALKVTAYVQSFLISSIFSFFILISQKA